MKLPSKIKSAKRYIASHKLVLTLVFILLLVLVSAGWNKYQDWDNAQMIKGLARDFPVLIDGIEGQTGLDLEIKTNCMTTQEKYGNGVSTCEALVVKNPVDSDVIAVQVEYFESRQKTLVKGEQFMNGEGFKYKYKNKNSCSVSYMDYIYISCVTAVRDANKKLAQQEFSRIN